MNRRCWLEEEVVVTKTRCCVLGATGFIGGRIAREAVERGWHVRGLRRRSGAQGAIGDLDVAWADGDLKDVGSLVETMAGCDVVFHAAAYYPEGTSNAWEAVEKGVAGMRNVLAAAAEADVGRLVYTSSLTTVGPPRDSRDLADEEDLYTPGSVPLPYFEVKWAMEMEAMRAAARGLPVVVVIPAAVLGPGDVKPTTGELLLWVAKGALPGYVEGEINVVDGRDVAAGEIAAAEKGEVGRRYILGGHNMTFRRVLSMAAEAAGRRPPRRAWPAWLIRAAAMVGNLLGSPTAQHLAAIQHWQPLDRSRAERELGLGDPIPFEKTCRDALAWFEARGMWEGA